MTMTPGSAYDAVGTLTLAEQALLAAELGGDFADPACATDSAQAVPPITRMHMYCGPASKDAAQAVVPITVYGSYCGHAPSDTAQAAIPVTMLHPACHF